jgi:hypothetical protein
MKPTNCQHCGKSFTPPATAEGELHHPCGPQYFCPACVDSEMEVDAELQAEEDAEQLRRDEKNGLYGED